MLQDICRLCTKNIDNDSKCVNLFEKNARRLLQQIRTFTGLILSNASNMPTNVCDICQTRLRKSLVFRQRCIKAQQQLEAVALADEQTKIEIKNEQEESISGDNMVEDSAENECFEEQYLLDDKDQQDTMEESMLIEQPVAEIEFTANEDEDDASQQTESVETSMEQVSLPIDIELDNGKHKKSKRRTRHLITTTDDNDNDNDDADADADDDDDDDYVANNKQALQKSLRSNITKLTQKPKSGKVTKFICDQCGNHIKGSYAFELHLRRHRGVKQHQCELCPDSFCTQSELRRHIRRHTGERPFACRYCDRHFTDYSTRIKHERTHTNERPFGCERCGKAFTNSSVLKNHMLTHTGERLFKCEFCNKSFLRQTHLSTHYRSTSHQKNAERHAQQQNNIMKKNININ